MYYPDNTVFCLIVFFSQ